MWTRITACSLLVLLDRTTASLPNACVLDQTLLNRMESSSQYQAPLFNCELENVAPGWYIVYFAMGKTLEQHRPRVGQALEDSDIGVVFDDTFSGRDYYSANLDADLLTVIRGNKNVEFVECDLIATAAI